jgi:hypothetical protein
MTEQTLREVLACALDDADLERPLSKANWCGKITEVLRAQPEFKDHPMLSRYGEGWISAAHSFPYPLLRVAAKDGPDDAVQWMQAMLQRQQATVVRILPIWGIEPSTLVTLSENISIVPLSELPASEQLQSYSSVRFALGQPAFRWEPPKAALTITSKISPLFVQANEAEHLINHDPKAHELLYEIRKCLTLAGPVRLAAAEEWSQFVDEGLSELPPLGVSFRPAEIQLWHVQPVGIFEEATAREVVSGYMRLSSPFREVFTMAVDRFDRALSRRNPGDAAVELSTALETMLGDGAGELVWKVGLRAALVGGGTLEHRKRIRAVVHAVYDLRSTVVHTGRTPAKAKLKLGSTMEVSELIKEAFSVVSLVLRNSLNAAETPDWFEAELLGLGRSDQPQGLADPRDR